MIKHGTEEKCIVLYPEWKRSGHFGDLDIDGRKILKWIVAGV